MSNLLSNSFRITLPIGLGLMFVLAVACGSPAAPSETAPPAAGAAPQPTAPAAVVPPQAAATATPVQPVESSSPAQQTADPPVATVLDRPTLNAGVIWLDSPFDPVLGG